MSTPPSIGQILVVDDEASIRYTFAKTLERAGYTVQTASSAEEALALLEETEFDVVLSDIRMTGNSGIELLAQVREKYPDTSVILITAYKSFESAVDSLRLGALDYIVKPSSNREILDSVGRGVERTQTMRSRRRLLKAIQDHFNELQAHPDVTPTPIRQLEASFDGNGHQAPPPPSAMSAIQIGALTLYPGRYQIAIYDQTLDLTPTEFDLLMYLVAHRGRVVPCGELVREVRGYGVPEEEAREIVRPHVANLRRKMKALPRNLDLITNVRSIGYRLADLG